MDKLAAVREKFICSLREKATELESCLEEGAATGSLENLNALVHKIAGSAGFYDQADVAAAATDIDQQLKTLTGEVLPQSLAKDIGRLIEVMRNCGP